MQEGQSRAIYSPRCSLQHGHDELTKLTTNLAIKIDKYILGFLKDSFEAHNDSLCLQEFIQMGRTHLRSWQRDLPDRDIKLLLCLTRLFEEASSDDRVNWAAFNSLLIEKGLTIKSLKSEQTANSLLRPLTTYTHLKHLTPIVKMVCTPNKLAVLCQQSNRVQLLQLPTMTQLKPILLTDHQQKVQTLVVKKRKDSKAKQTYKKEVVVAMYKYSILDMIYIEHEKYKMLLTSSSDRVVRGWDVTSTIPTIAKQPDNEDEKMVHQFPKQMHCLAWDSSNEVLYCSGDENVIYQWLVKTDSERELCDTEGHTMMIACMLVMPKLQFLATGGYDGKLILWETISQTKKFKYESHTRSISSITFHQQLILLFTAAYDHCICVWNPYIPSLVHKIIGTITILQLQIIPNTDFLLALDAEGNVKLREVHKFTQVSAFSLNRQDNHTEPTCIAKANKRYFFGGLCISAYEYSHNDAAIGADTPLLTLRYTPHTFLLYAPIKNAVLVWSILTGALTSTLTHQCDTEITAFHTTHTLSIVGDLAGNLSLRKLENGFLIKRLTKFKSTVLHVLVIDHTFIAASSQDGQITIFTINGDPIRSFHIKRIHPTATIKMLYAVNNMLVVVGRELYFVGVEKNKMLGSWTEAQDIIHTATLEDILLCITPTLQVIGLHLPPHHQKFKKAFHLSPDQTLKVTGVTVVGRRVYAGTETNDLLCYEIGEKTLRFVWKTPCTDAVRHIIHLQREDLLAVMVGSKTVWLVICETGTPIAQLSQRSLAHPSPPLLSVNEQQGLISVQGQSVPFAIEDEEQQLRRVVDPNFYFNIVRKTLPLLQLKSNSTWHVQPNIAVQVDAQIQTIMHIKHRLHAFKGRKIEREKSTPNFNVKVAVEMQQKWERQKEEGEEQMEKTLFQRTWGRLSKEKETIKKNQRLSCQNEKYKNISESPMFRLGLALKNVNQRDPKAQLFMEPPLKKKSLIKLPKI